MHNLFLTLKRSKDVRHSFYCAALCWIILFNVSFNCFTGRGNRLELILPVFLAYIATLYFFRMKL